jgi:reverse transcriptase-like protein
MLQGMGYHHTTADHAIFTCTAGKLPLIIALYVDDITMICKDLDTIQWDKATLQKQYQMTDLREIAWILGMHITRNCKEGWIALSQEKFSGKILE